MSSNYNKYSVDIKKAGVKQAVVKEVDEEKVNVKKGDLYNEPQNKEL